MSPVYRAAHTPGPWRVDTTMGKNIYILNQGGYSLAQVQYLGAYSVKTKKANARLIAAAPELLAALQFYVGICGNTCAVVDRQSAFEMHAQATAAIAKATGAA